MIFLVRLRRCRRPTQHAMRLHVLRFNIRHRQIDRHSITLSRFRYVSVFAKSLPSRPRSKLTHTNSKLPMTHSIWNFGADIPRKGIISNSIFNYYVETKHTACRHWRCVVHFVFGRLVWLGRVQMCVCGGWRARGSSEKIHGNHWIEYISSPSKLIRPYAPYIRPTRLNKIVTETRQESGVEPQFAAGNGRRWRKQKIYP